VLAHDPQQSMLTTIRERATAYASGWNKVFAPLHSSDGLRGKRERPFASSLPQLAIYRQNDRLLGVQVPLSVVKSQ